MKLRDLPKVLLTALYVAFTAFLLLTFAFLILIEQGLQHPLGSLRAKGEMRTYLEERYGGEDLRTGLPTYNMIMDDFSAFVKDPHGQVLFGLTWAEDTGIVERGAHVTEDGRYYLSYE